MNHSAFINLLEPFKQKAYRLALRMLESKEEAQDAVQELYFKFWKNRFKVKEYKNVEAFAMTTVKNYCLDRIKSKQFNNLRLVDQNYKEKHELQHELEVNDEMVIIKKMIDKLPKKQKMIIQLRDIEGYEFDEIGSLLDLKPTAVRVGLSRARNTIREKLLKQKRYEFQEN